MEAGMDNLDLARIVQGKVSRIHRKLEIEEKVVSYSKGVEDSLEQHWMLLRWRNIHKDMSIFVAFNHEHGQQA